MWQKKSEKILHYQLKLWSLNDSSCKQSILHPNTVWGVGSLPNGDVVSACADGFARVFTASPARMAEDTVKECKRSCNLCDGIFYTC